MKTSEWLKKYNIRLKKSLGQVFLSTQLYAKKIVEKAGIESNDLIIEIGAGAGTLTEELAKTQAQILAFEIDQRLFPLLEERLKKYKNVTLHFKDFLEYDFSNINSKVKVIANVPYHISSKILEKIFKELDFSYAVLMFQKEYAERILSPKGRNFGPLSVFVQIFCKVEKLLYVPKSAFVPNPKVDSLVIKLIKKRETLEVNIDEFMNFTKILFSKRRKNLKNSLSSIAGNSSEKILEILKIDKNTRIEQLTTDQILALYQAYKKIKK